jgi:predicted DNA-binding transcriptional regulator YafY
MLIINFLRRGKATFRELNNYLERESEIQGYEFVISQRTFQRDVNEIRSIYNVDIKSDKSSGLYFIEEESELDDNRQMLDAFNLYNALNLTTNYNKYIQFDTRMPKGTENLYGILHSIKNRHVIEITYKKYYETEEEKRTLEPYLLKEVKGRWYLLAKSIESNGLRTFGLDRIINLDIKKQRFPLSNSHNWEKYYYNSFGIIAPDGGKAEKIVFSFNVEQGNYIKSYPLHHSQKVIKETDDEIRFEITVFNTYDLIMELLSHTGEIKIHSPKTLITQLNKIYKTALNK